MICAYVSLGRAIHKEELVEGQHFHRKYLGRAGASGALPNGLATRSYRRWWLGVISYHNSHHNGQSWSHRLSWDHMGIKFVL